MSAPRGIEFDHDFLGIFDILFKVGIGQRQYGISPGLVGFLGGWDDKDKGNKKGGDGAQTIQCFLTV